MIKAEVAINGVISRAATQRTGKDGKAYTQLTLTVNVGDIAKETMPIEISVIKDGYNIAEANQYGTGKRVEIIGTLTFKKRGENMYVNLSAKEIHLTPASVTDAINGDLEFRGTLGKTIDERNDKNGKPYQLFSGYSAEKINETFEFTWVRFARFAGDSSSILVPSAKVEAKGKLTITVYRKKLNLDCRVDEIKEWVKQPYQETNKDLPF
jgi:hypothetical protein